ncbi:uncharacterized protein LOC106883796 isoform X2 [Octopus bimaculoides]|uniref:uncharacterized protein LOC106883796 isoform X2 n=1 Tax=Octopus bimaculoides TaxID=37653 RepID=UPI0022E40F09|nr:uncharacterized protein LOC106883796 isoform X2 [Octopus bimaculoides]
MQCSPWTHQSLSDRPTHTHTDDNDGNGDDNDDDDNDLLKFSLVSVLYSWFCSGSHVTCSRLEAGRCCLNPRQDLEDWTPILNWKTIQNKLPWGIVLVMGGGFAIADVSRVSTGFLINVVCVLTLTLAVHS